MPENETVNILIVDDDEVDRRHIQRGLQKHKISNPVYFAEDGLEALELLRGTGGKQKVPRPHLILLDLNMPRMDGVKFLEAIRNDDQLDDSVIFVLTTSNRDEDKTAAYKKHIAGYVLKSEAGEGFLKMVELIEKYVLTVQFPPPRKG